ncbi:hypothetical protein LguiA_021574 [Lonicera macranthoides]
MLKDPTGQNIWQKYDLGREVGRGEFGITYLCTDVQTGEKFACKSENEIEDCSGYGECEERSGDYEAFA